jgi:hypothetical protein
MQWLKKGYEVSHPTLGAKSFVKVLLILTLILRSAVDNTVLINTHNVLPIFRLGARSKINTVNKQISTPFFHE